MSLIEQVRKLTDQYDRGLVTEAEYRTELILVLTTIPERGDA